jgi:high-affinity iron transporter
LLVALREGVEAALVVGIVLVYLDRTGRRELARFVWAGVFLAAAASFAAAVLLQRWRVSEDGFEGLLMLLAGVLVVTMIVWMNRVARRLKKEIEQRVEGFAQRASPGGKQGFAAGLGLALFVFLMVLREGAELVLILRAVELSTAGIEVWICTGLGLAVSIAV